MEQILRNVNALVPHSPESEAVFRQIAHKRHYQRKEWIIRAGDACDEVFFVNSGLIRMVLDLPDGTEQTGHFALEDTWVCSYTSFLLREPAAYAMQALEDTEVMVITREGLNQLYESTPQGDRVGRKIAENLFIDFDQRIRSIYLKSPKQRYDEIEETFPNIHNRVPQHMIASYLGISPVHLSRLKKEALAAKS